MSHRIPKPSFFFNGVQYKLKVLEVLPYGYLNEPNFFARFGNYDTAKLIGSDEHKKSDEEPITSFDMAECITLFAIEKRGSTIEAILSWHISDDTSVDTIKGEDFLDVHLFGKSSESEGPEDSRGKKYDLYIVGGDETTTQG